MSNGQVMRLRLWAVSQMQRSSALRACVGLLYGALRLVIPTNLKQIGFVSSPDLSDNALALFEKILELPRERELRLVWLVKSLSASKKILRREFPNADLKNVSLITKNSLRGLMALLRCRYVFETHGIYGFAHFGRHQTIVNLWHGMPIKTIGAFDNKVLNDIPFMHYSIATSEFFAGIIAKTFYLEPDCVFVTGLPRNEWLFQPEERYFALKENREKLIVWLPTYRDSYIGDIRHDSSEGAPDPLDAGTLAQLDEMLDGAGVLLVIKLHLMDLKNKQKWPAYRNIRIYTESRFQAEGLNLYKLLACSDALVTDFSSCAIDYLLLNRPIGIFAPDKSFYTRGFIPGVLEKFETVGQELRSIGELGEFMKSLPPPMKVTPDAEDLCRMDLRNPSQAILRAIGITDIL